MTRPLKPLCRTLTGLAFVGLLLTSLGGCVETVPDELVEAIESLDRDLVTLRAADISPDRVLEIQPPMDCITDSRAIRREYRSLALGGK